MKIILYEVMGSANSCFGLKNKENMVGNIYKIMLEDEWKKAQRINRICDSPNNSLICCFDHQINSIVATFRKEAMGKKIMLITFSKKEIYENGFTIKQEKNIQTNEIFPCVYPIKENETVPFNSIISVIYMKY